MKRDFINIQNFSKDELEYLLGLTTRIKSEPEKYADRLKAKSIALVFQKPSNRTRVSFEVGVYQLGGNCIYLGPEEINLGQRESTHDVAKTLSRYVDGIVARTFSHQDVIDLAKEASVPVINGLSDLSHPCQALADIFTVKEKFGKTKDLTLAYIGDGNNVCHSLMFACAIVGINVAIAAPKGYTPSEEIVKGAQQFANKTSAFIKVFKNPQEAVKGADILYTDTWVSMGQEEEAKKRLKEFDGFQINKKLASLAKSDYIFMHCLPAHRGQEVTEDIIDGEHSVIFEQAENRMHAQKAILLYLIRNEQ